MVLPDFLSFKRESFQGNWIGLDHRVNDQQPIESANIIEGQLNTEERGLITSSILNAPVKPRVAVEVGTWLGGGSTLHILRALERNGVGHLYGIEADSSIYERMVANIRKAAPEAAARFTPIFGLSDDALPKWVAGQGKNPIVDFAFLDGGNNPMEQIMEFSLLDKYMPVGAQLLSHDAKKRKGKYLVPYMQLLDNWETQLNDLSEYGMFYARKRREFPSDSSLKTAKKKLRQLRLEPKEIAATVLPKWFCGLFLNMLPRRLAHTLSDEK
jgi:predicted O-methyltransferase YrrM